MADGGMEMLGEPTKEFSVRDLFGIDTDMTVKGFAEPSDRVPDRDPTYRFDRDTTLAILAGFARGNAQLLDKGAAEELVDALYYAGAAFNRWKAIATIREAAAA